MKKILLGFLMALSLFIIGCDKGKDKILGGNSYNILLEADDNLKFDDILENKEYGINEEFWKFYPKYTKTVLQTLDNETTGNVRVDAKRIVFKIQSTEELDEINKYIEEFNKNSKNIVIEYRTLLGDAGVYHCSKK